MFKDFWATKSKEVQNTFIKSHVQVCRAKRDRRQLENVKQRVNRKYFLSKDGVSTPVCYAMFRNTLGVTEKEVRSLTNDITIVPDVTPNQIRVCVGKVSQPEGYTEDDLNFFYTSQLISSSKSLLQSWNR